MDGEELLTRAVGNGGSPTIRINARKLLGDITGSILKPLLIIEKDTGIRRTQMRDLLNDPELFTIRRIQGIISKLLKAYEGKAAEIEQLRQFALGQRVESSFTIKTAIKKELTGQSKKAARGRKRNTSDPADKPALGG